MNLVKAGLRKWYDRYEATEYLSGKVGSPIESETVIVAAIRPKGVRLFLHVPPHTEDKRGVFLDEGLWDLVTERTDQGRPARQYLSWLINEQTSLKGLTGAFIKRDGDKWSPRQLNPRVDFSHKADCAWPDGCELAFKKEDLDRLATMLKIGTPTPAPEAAEKSDKPLGERERTTLLVIIAALAAEADIDLSHPSTAAARIEEMTGRLGVRVTARTAEDHLKRVRKLLDERGNPHN